MNARLLALAVPFVIWSCGSSDDGGDAPASPSPAATVDPTTTPPPPPPAVPAVNDSCPVSASTDPLVVATTRGLVGGKTSGNVDAFLGIPYAAPPVGSLRFAPTVKHACWTDVRPATEYGAECMQLDATTGNPTGSEDCLFANVWRPKGATGKLPVLYWVHGGANVLGSANQTLSAVSGNLYDGSKLAERENAVIVSVNYRLGALGFLAHPALASESPHQASGNYAYHDQIAGLQWVHDNIERFGGDASQVMLFGESAGAMSTCILLQSPLATGLFSSALMESGDCSARETTVATTEGTAHAQKLGCADAACLRQLSANDILKATPPFTSEVAALDVDMRHGLAGSVQWAASVDGWLVPSDPRKRIEAGTYNEVPLLIGTNAQEMALFLVASTSFTCSQYDDDMKRAFGAADAATIEAMYPCTIDGRGTEVHALTDLAMTCPSRRIARASAKAGAPTYLYSFAHTADYGSTVLLGAYHAAELPYVFDSFGAMGYVPTPRESDLSHTMQDHWGAFARTHAPGASWPAFTDAAQKLMVFDNDETVKSDDTTAACQMWATLLGW